MYFTKKQAWAITMTLSVIFGILGGPIIGGAMAFGFFVLLTA